MNLILPDDSVIDWLRALTEGLNIFSDLQVCLYKVDLPINRYTYLAQLVANECTFDGYARWLLTDFTTPILRSAYLAEVQPVNPEFHSVLDSDDIFGVFITDTMNTFLFGVGKFDAPVRLADSRYLYLELTVSLASLVTV